jgi:diacylglycerol O-acyltransferase / wax synthase
MGWTESRPVYARAVGNGEAVVRLERHLHIAWEPWLSQHPLPGFSGFYDWANLAVMVVVLTWCAVREEEAFWRFARNSLAIIAGVGFVTYAVLPMAPPRLLPAAFGMGGGTLGALGNVADQLGAMPSLHTAWAGWAALMVFAMWGGSRVLQWVGWVNLLLTVVVVVTTGNHYVLDVVAGELLTLAAVFLADRISRRSRKKLGVVTVPRSADTCVNPGPGCVTGGPPHDLCGGCSRGPRVSTGSVAVLRELVAEENSRVGIL